MNKLNKIMEILRKDNFMIIDDHDNRERHLDGVIVLNNGELAQFIYCMYQSLNALYIGEDGKVHLGMWSIAGTLMGTKFKEYNESVLYDRMKINQIYYEDGTVEKVA